MSTTEQSVKEQVANLPEILQKEWKCIVGYYSSKSDTTVFEDFKKRYDNFEGKTIEEFLAIPKVVYTEWENWKYRNGFEKSLTQVFGQFKEFWQYDSEASKVMFKEMEFLSENMIREWRLKYNFVYSHVYEKDPNNYSCIQRDYHLKSKAQLWEEFKEIWEIDMIDYNEDKYDEMRKYISEIQCDSKNYFREYPRNFFEFRENANYHSFDSYSIIEQFEICEYWECLTNYAIFKAFDGSGLSANK